MIQMLFKQGRLQPRQKRGLTKATDGATNPEKTFWYLIVFKCINGTWIYKLIPQCPGTLYTNDLWGDRKPL
jgi:hypothetical protein